MRKFIISETQLVMLATLGKPIDLSFADRRDWQRLLGQCRKYVISENISVIRLHGENREGKNIIEEIILPKWDN